jgi:hypothetical protein
MSCFMPTAPAQLFLSVLELTLWFAGGGLLLWVLFSPRQRARWLGIRTLPQLSLTPGEFIFGAVVIFLCGMAGTAAVQLTIGKKVAAASEHESLKLLVYGLANYAGAAVGWRVVFPYLIRSWQIGNYPPPTRSTRVTLGWSEVTGYAMGTVLVAMPLLVLVSLGWVSLLRAIGLPDQPQDLIALFAQMKSPWIAAGMLLIACVLAPIYEELAFRAGLYRYARQKIGRLPALLISGFCFGALHGNWAGFLPLAVLGMLLALVYEATGSIRVAIVAHGLFNLHTILLVLSGIMGPNA